MTSIASQWRAGVDWTGVTPQHEDALSKYILHGEPLPPELGAILANGDTLRFENGGHYRRSYVLRLTNWLFIHAPPVCMGSRENVERWIARKGLTGENAS